MSLSSLKHTRCAGCIPAASVAFCKVFNEVMLWICAHAKLESHSQNWYLRHEEVSLQVTFAHTSNPGSSSEILALLWDGMKRWSAGQVGFCSRHSFRTPLHFPVLHARLHAFPPGSWPHSPCSKVCCESQVCFDAWYEANDCITRAGALPGQKAGCVLPPQMKGSSCSGEDYILIPLREKQ